MLHSLHIENIAVIEKADVDFQEGLNILTGETGAGKSIVIDAINAVLGGRVSRDLVRAGAQKALVSASFDSEGLTNWFEENEIDLEEDEIILQRRIASDGKSTSRVNGVPISVLQLKELGSLLIDIHGQNDGRQLLDEKNHQAYLDRFGVPDEIIIEYHNAYNSWKSLFSEKTALIKSLDEKDRLKTSLEKTIDELTSAAITDGEEAQLISRRDLLRNSEKLTELLSSSAESLYEAESNAVSLCSDAEYNLSRAVNWCLDLQSAVDELRSARFSMEDAVEKIKEQLDELDFSPNEYNELEERISLLNRLQRKYRTDERGLIELLSSSQTQLSELEYADERLIKLEKQIVSAEQGTIASGKKLSSARHEAAEKLEKKIIKELSDLSMPSVRFKAEFSPVNNSTGFTDSGMDEIRFTMSANAGEKLGPIAKIASGGELSRIMLALKNVFAEKDLIPTQIFDEIDTGVSGIAAQRVGEKLAVLSRRKQVICITHLPQIASMADAHLKVEKSEIDHRTYTKLEILDQVGRIKEIARLQGGEIISDTVLAAAEEQIRSAKEFKNNI